MNHKPESHDREYLAELMEDFPVGTPPDVGLASKLLHLRYSTLKIEQFTNALNPLGDDEFVERFQTIPLKMHRYLYNGIVSNAGIYRNGKDPNGGLIFFGPKQKYRGHSPHTISAAVKDVCSLLTRGEVDPVSTVVQFYQQFVFIHPFYDANGRIGRFVTTLYLDYHGYYISWKRMHQNQKWLKKLNNCHNRMGGYRYESYLELLITYWKQFIKRKEEIEPLFEGNE